MEGPHVRNGAASQRIKLLLMLQEVRPIYKTRNQLYNNPRSVERALDELHDEKILLAITKEILRGPRKRLVDIKYTSLNLSLFVGA